MITKADFLDSIRKNFVFHQRGTTWFNQTEINIINEIEKLHGIGKSEVLTRYWISRDQDPDHGK